MSSYLEILMNNPAPEKSAFRLSVQEEEIIVPDTNISDPEKKKEFRKEEFKKQQSNYKNKNALRKRNPNDESQPKKDFDPNYKSALEEAQKICLELCKPNSEQSDNISQSIKHVHNWEGQSIRVDLEDDDIKLELLDKEYSFSKKRFLGNKYFQNNVRDYYKEQFENTFLKFFESKDGKSYKIIVKASTM